MSDYFSSMKKNRKKSTEKMRERIEKENSGGQSNSDDREWKLQRDKAGNGYAIIRFLPPSEQDVTNAPEGTSPEDVSPWALVWQHGFKVNGRWFINECPRTIGNDCPVCEKEKELVENAGGWDLPREHPARKTYTDRKGKKNYYSNVLVVKDTANPDNEGKVFIFRYGPKIHEKILAPMFPEFEDEESMDPFDAWDGANFKLKAQNKDGYVNYDRSEFESPSAIAEDDDDIERILMSGHYLGSYLAPDKYKDEAKLTAEYNKIVNGTEPKRKSVEEEDDSKVDNNVDRNPRVDKKTVEKSTPSSEPEVDNQPDMDDGEEDGEGGDLDYFKGLLDED